MKQNTGKPFGKLSTRSSADHLRPPDRSESGGVVAFPSDHLSVVRDMGRVDGNLRDLTAAVHRSFLATFDAIPQSLLAAAAELVADRQRDQLAVHWRAVLRLYVESLETGLVVVDIVARAHGLQWLGLATADSVRRISHLVLDRFITTSHGTDNDAEISSLFDRLSAETGHFTELLSELRRKANCCSVERDETNSAS